MKMAVSRDVEAAETQDPLLEYSVSSTHDVKLKWKILKYVDIFLSSTVLCFFIVACWTGTWTLLDIYGEYFPVYESFALSIFIHFVFAMCQKFFHNLLVEKPSKSVATKCVNWLLHKIYFLIFYISGIMNWRSGSIIFEDVFGITPDTTMYDFGVLLSTIATLVCCTILMWLGGMCNVTSAPMQVTVDCKSETFLFNYKFFRAAYILLFLNQPYDGSTTTDAQTIRVEPVKERGRPFKVNVLGPPPQEFTPTTPSSPPTTKKRRPISPEINYHKQHQYSKNIQEIISYITSKPAKEESENNYLTDEEEPKAASRDFVSYSSPDQFYSYKPRDISEVNLLANNHVRFSPPPWKDFQKFNRLPIPINRYYVNNSDIDNVTKLPKLMKNLHNNYQTQLINYPNVNTTIDQKIPTKTVLNTPNIVNKGRPEIGNIVATVRKPLLVNINIAPMTGNDDNIYSKNPHEPDTDEAMNLQLKVYPDMALFPEYRKKNPKKHNFVTYK